MYKDSFFKKKYIILTSSLRDTKVELNLDGFFNFIIFYSTRFSRLLLGKVKEIAIFKKYFTIQEKLFIVIIMYKKVTLLGYKLN